MINSGVTHNVIHQKIVEELKLPITRGTELGVTIGVVTIVEREGIYRTIKLKLPELTIRVNFLTINLGKRDVVV